MNFTIGGRGGSLNPCGEREGERENEKERGEVGVERERGEDIVEVYTEGRNDCRHREWMEIWGIERERRMREGGTAANDPSAEQGARRRGSRRRDEYVEPSVCPFLSAI